MQPALLAVLVSGWDTNAAWTAFMLQPASVGQCWVTSKQGLGQNSSSSA